MRGRDENPDPLQERPPPAQAAELRPAPPRPPVPAPPRLGAAPPDWLLAVTTARSAPAGSESAEPEPEPKRPRRRSRARSSRRCPTSGPHLPSRSNAGRTQTGWRELGPGRWGPVPGPAAEGGAPASPGGPAFVPGAGGRRRLLSALRAGASAPARRGAEWARLRGLCAARGRGVSGGRARGPRAVRPCAGSGAGTGWVHLRPAPRTGAGDRGGARTPSRAAPSMQEGGRVRTGKPG